MLDVRMAHMSGPALQDELNAMGARIPIIFLSGHGDVAVAVKTIKAGAVDFVQKPYREQQLLDSINDALRRDAENRRAASGSEGFAERLATLTERERGVLAQVVKGLSSKEIAKVLDISYRTVELHRSHIMEKLRVHSLAELARPRRRSSRRLRHVRRIRVSSYCSSPRHRPLLARSPRRPARDAALVASPIPSVAC